MIDVGKASSELFSSLVLVAEMRPHDARLEIFESAKILDDIAAGIIKEQLAIFGATDGNDPFQIVAVFKQVVNRLSNATTRDDSDSRSRQFFLLRHRFGKYLGREGAETSSPRLGTPLVLSQ